MPGSTHAAGPARARACCPVRTSMASARLASTMLADSRSRSLRTPWNQKISMGCPWCSSSRRCGLSGVPTAIGEAVGRCERSSQKENWSSTRFAKKKPHNKHVLDHP